MTDDDRIEHAVLAELADGVRALDAGGLQGARVDVSRLEQFSTTSISVTGRFASLPDREVSAVVEIDPGRKGWRIEGTLYEYLDSERSQQRVRDLGGYRMADAAIALEDARRLARAAWVALREYVRSQTT
jgi:hypothetical protein